jgi:hypothetical protein
VVATRLSTDAPIDVTARDQRTIEVRQVFLLPQAPGEEVSYQTDLWFHFSPGFGISPATFSVDDFYRDAQVHLRLHAPALTLHELADLDHPGHPGTQLRNLLPRLLSEDVPPSAALETLAKAYGAELADAVTTAAKRARQHLDEDAAAAFLSSIEALDGDLQQAVGAMRRLRAKARAHKTVAPPNLLPALAFADEYASAVFDERLAELCHAADQAPCLHRGDGTALRARLSLLRTAAFVYTHRCDQGFAVLHSGNVGHELSNDDRAHDEYVAYRLGLLKKEMQRALYLDTRAAPADPFVRNSAAMVAAGLAATWATLAQVPLLQEGLSTGQSGVLFGAAVGAYVLKDRIKEWTRVTLTKRFLRWDHDRHIVGDALTLAGLGGVSGRAQERLHYCKDDELPVEVRAVRAAVRTVPGVSPEREQVLHYERKVSFEANDGSPPSDFGAQELFRLSLDEVIKRLDDPVDPLSYFDAAQQSFTVRAMPKVYHLNLVVRITHRERAWLERYRVVVNQGGILRIELVPLNTPPSTS